MQIHPVHDTMRPVHQFDPKQRVVVHPGWLSNDLPLFEEEADDHAEMMARFNAFAQIMRTAGALDRASADILAELGLTAGAFFALLELQAAGPEGLAPSELARRLAVARRTATLYVDILAREGWVSRDPHPADRRMVLARVTPVGEELLARAGDGFRRKLGDLVATLTPLQAERLRQLMAIIPLESDTLEAAFLHQATGS
jgi:DNA-binding MarR family transcriptional regulator